MAKKKGTAVSKEALEVTRVRFPSVESTSVEYETSNFGTPEGHHLKKCADKRRESFDEAIATVQSDVSKALALGGLSKRFALLGMSQALKEGGRREYTFDCRMSTPVGEVEFSSPPMRGKVAGEAIKQKVISDVALKHIRALLEEAVAYSSGQREQTELALDEAQQSAAEN